MSSRKTREGRRMMKTHTHKTGTSTTVTKKTKKDEEEDEKNDERKEWQRSKKEHVTKNDENC